MELFARTCHFERMNVQRIIARAFVIFGGVFWIVAAFGASWAYRDEGFTRAIGTTLLPLLITVAAFLIGWFYERLASVLLLAGAAAVVVWGIAAGWEGGVWTSVVAVLVAPMLIAATLFYLAARMQVICSLEREGL